MVNPSNRRLRIAINSQMFAEKGVGGIETVLVALVQALGKLDGPEEYVLIGPWENADWLKPYTGPNQTIVRGPKLEFAKRAAAPFRPVLSAARRLLRNAVGRSSTWPLVPKSNGFYERLGCDLIYFPTPQFIRSDLPAVYNVHDLQHLHYPSFFSSDELIWKEKMFRAGCEGAHTIVAISQWVKRDIVDQYQTDPARVQVIYFASPTQVHSFPGDALARSVPKKYSLTDPFALFPSMIRIHKNHIGLLEALAFLRDQHGLRLQLVCTGYQTEFWSTIKKRLMELRLQNQVKFLGMVEPVELRALYRLAEFVVFPSLFEGAGMPLLEAWQDNAPVTCSGVTSLPELAADGALLFDPASVKSIAGALAEMHTNPALREDLRRRGARRLQDFSWERTAKQYRAVFRKAAGRQLNEEDLSLLADHLKDVPTCESI